MSHLIMSRLTKNECLSVVEQIAGELKRRAGSGGRSEIDIRRALSKLNVLLSERMLSIGQDALYLTSDETATYLPLIILNASLRGATRRARALAHEAAHELMRNWVAEAVYDVDQVICTNQDVYAVRQWIARSVDEKYA